MKILILISLLIFSFISFSQTDKEYRYVPFFQTLKADKLAYHLTKNLESDSEKVVAIHSWITHNIEFDINRWLSFNYSPTPTNRILFKRKAISTDYSRLFNELCLYSNIQSTTIQGYTKNEYSDLLDKFYIDEQTWNAVKINQNWYLIDACMDAGKVEYYKRTFAGYFIFAFSLGTSDRLVYKPHFSSQPTDKYFCKNGYFFKSNHFPNNPIWQLTNPISTFESFEKDSSNYFNSFDTLTSNQSKDDFDITRERFISSKKNQKEIIEGIESNKTNFRNNYGIAKATYLIASQKFESFNVNSGSKEEASQKADSIHKLLSNSKIYTDTNVYFLKLQKSELIAKNTQKKEIITKENKQLIASTDNSLKILSSGFKISLSGKINLKTTQQKNKIYKYKVTRSKKFKNTDFGKRTNRIDSVNYANRIILFSDSVEFAKKQIDLKFNQLQEKYDLFSTRMEEYKIQSSTNDKTAKQLCNLRLKFQDDLDYPIRKLKDSLIPQKLKDDSLLIDKNKMSIVSNFYNQFNTLKEDFANYYKYSTALETEFSKYKKSIKENTYIELKHKDETDLFMKNIKEFNSTLKTYKKKFKLIYKISKQQIKPTKAENHSYLKEQFIEFQMNVIRANFINRRYKERLSENKSLVSKISKLNKKLEKEILKIKLK